MRCLIMLTAFFMLSTSYASNIIFGSGNGSYFSNNNGLSWKEITINNKPNLQINANIVYIKNNTLYCAVNNIGLVVSHDYGKNWSLVESVPQVLSYFHNIQYINGNIYISALSGLYRSSDNGYTFSRVIKTTIGKVSYYNAPCNLDSSNRRIFV